MKTFMKYLQYKICFITPFCLIGMAAHSAPPEGYIIAVDFILFTIATMLATHLFSDTHRKNIALVAALVFWCSELAFHYEQSMLDAILTLIFNLIVFYIAKETTMTKTVKQKAQVR